MPMQNSQTFVPPMPDNQKDNQRDNHRADTDPNVLQSRASNPEHSVWVGASAGTGKTKVLTDRVLRLLLPNPITKAEGTPPHKILCLTFTKAGATEMKIRLQQRLGKWAVMDEDKLVKQLKDLTGHMPDADLISFARTLFARVIDSPDGLKIMTIHSFCQSVLGRFPLEAKISPHFEVMDEGDAKDILENIRNRILTDTDHVDDDLRSALKRLAAQLSEDNVTFQIQSLLQDRRKLTGITDQFDGYDDLYNAIAIGLKLDTDKDDPAGDYYSLSEQKEQTLWELSRALQTANAKTVVARGQTLQAWLEADEYKRQKMFGTYKSIFLTKESKVASLGNVFARDNVIANNLFEDEAIALRDLENIQKAIQCARATADILFIAKHIIGEYQAHKHREGFLDYDDMILKTRDLFSGSGAAWVLYKMDGGIDHILIDEAQDTNPEQWDIINALTHDFFSGRGQHEDTHRTIFTVGDDKQSIYSFQRADPREFHGNQMRYTDALSNIGEALQNVKLNISFRSTAAVLNLVDAVFAAEAARDGLSYQDTNVKHTSHRNGDAGEVTLWPLVVQAEKEERKAWTPPTQIVETQDAKVELATMIALQIREWLDTKNILESENRPIEPKDIMILVRTRSAFVKTMMRVLKDHNIPVSGMDRMVVTEDIAVEDLLAIASFAMLPEDDLTLATILKSPLIGLSEDDVYNIAVDRTGSLWKSLKSSAHNDAVEYLTRLIDIAGSYRPYEFFAAVLNEKCPADPSGSGIRAIKRRLGNDTQDTIEEFLNMCIDFEVDNRPSLQAFVQFAKSNSKDIKREAVSDANEVQIMTVHGSKGLEAPIVFLPDTMRTPQTISKGAPKFLWPETTDLAVPLWAPQKAMQCNHFTWALDNKKVELEQEYRRLLYVAMTRAADRLIICGYKGQKSGNSTDWYDYIRAGFENLPDVIERPFAFGKDKDLKTFSYQTFQTKDAKQKSRDTANVSTPIKPPDYIFSDAPEEPSPVRPLSPSRPDEEEPSSISPLAMANDQHRFERGRLTHKLLQYLPDIESSKWQKYGGRFLDINGTSMPDNVLKSILTETINILNHPQYSAIFGPGSMAEVPLSGMIDDTAIVTGQIDRLLITPNTVMIIDYKTNRPSPDSQSKVPEAYIFQMQKYKDLLSRIYPNRYVKCALLWTDGPTLMPIDNLLT